MIAYENFDLRIRPDGAQFVVSAQRAEQSATEPFLLERALSKDLRYLAGADADTLHRHGADLFDTLIQGRVRDLYQQGRGHAARGSAGLRIRLFFDPREERLRSMIRVPWELLRDPNDANDLPALDARRPIVRVLDTTEQQLTPAEGPLQRVLLALANPQQTTSLDLDRERGSVQNALARIGLRPRIVRPATRTSLYDAIADGSPHIVHFMGHSDVDPDTGEGILLLEDESGGPDPLPGTVFARFFIGRPAPRLVVLTSCLSATQGRSANPFAGIAFALVAAGLPAVLAMQSAVEDDHAIRFTERLYRRLVDNDPIEGAVADARKAVSVGRLTTLDWAAPVLFMRETVDMSVRSRPEEPSTAPLIATSPATPTTFIDARESHAELQINAGIIHSVNASRRGVR